MKFIVLITLNFHHILSYRSDVIDDSGTFTHRYRSFFIVPVYVIVGSFPVLIVSKVIYNIWKLKAASYLVSLVTFTIIILIIIS